MSAAGSFTLLADKPLLSECLCAEWCPKMDLLALSTLDGQLCVHRLNWQKLWAVTPEHPVTALCWRPDGKAIAAGQEDGTVVVYDVEDGEALQRRRVHMDPIASACWLEAPQPETTSLSARVRLVMEPRTG
eukprot:3449255-Pyramimonas_sp.AAC.1